MQLTVHVAASICGTVYMYLNKINVLILFYSDINYRELSGYYKKSEGTGGQPGSDGG